MFEVWADSQPGKNKRHPFRVFALDQLKGFRLPTEYQNYGLIIEQQQPYSL
jgi:hypothetical protein